MRKVNSLPDMTQDASSDRKGKSKASGLESSERKDQSPRKRKTVNYSDFAPLEAPGPSRPSSPPLAQMTKESTADDIFSGMDDEEIFRLVTRPDEIEGVADWGIPPEVDPDQAADPLKVSWQVRRGHRRLTIL